MHPRDPSPLSNQQVPRPFFQTTSYLSHRTDRPNLRQPTPIAPPVFIAKSRPADQPNGSRGKPSGRKIDKDKPRWDPIPITYTELFPKLVEIDQIEPVQLAPLRPPFPRWYNAHTRCDYHAGNPGHSTKNCTGLKRRVRDLINEEKLKFDKSDGLVEAEDPSRVKFEMPRQEKETPRRQTLEKRRYQWMRQTLLKFEKVKQALHRPLKGQRNDHASQMRRKRKRCSSIWSET